MVVDWSEAEEFRTLCKYHGLGTHQSDITITDLVRAAFQNGVDAGKREAEPRTAVLPIKGQPDGVKLTHLGGTGYRLEAGLDAYWFDAHELAREAAKGKLREWGKVLEPIPPGEAADPDVIARQYEWNKQMSDHMDSLRAKKDWDRKMDEGRRYFGYITIPNCPGALLERRFCGKGRMGEQYILRWGEYEQTWVFGTLHSTVLGEKMAEEMAQNILLGWL